jgi:threonine dehydratase
MTALTVSLADVMKAQAEIRKYIPPTPLVLNSWLSEALGCELYLKLENMQPIGSFKIRGATYKISRLSADQKAKGVIAASAGNHAQGVAWGSRKLGVKALIVMPKGAALVKVQNTRALGAEVLFEGETFEEAFAAAREHERKTGRVFVHAYEDADVIAGQGTVGLEILEQLPDVDAVFSSIGGGGLMSGVSLVLKELKPAVKVYGCQASGARSMVDSIKQGKAVRLSRVDTFADGIAVAQASEKILEILKPRLDDCLAADDEAIVMAVLTLLDKAKVISEGSGALPIAVIEQMKEKLKGKKVVAIISGGNIDVNVLSRVIDRGLTLLGRRLRVNVLMSDRPGSLAKLTELIAKAGANVLQVLHDRNEPSTTIDLTEVALTLETKGPEHSQSVIDAIKTHAIRVELAH